MYIHFYIILVKKIETGKKFAIKIMKKKDLKDQKEVQQILNERSILKQVTQLQNPSLISLELPSILG